MSNESRLKVNWHAACGRKLAKTQEHRKFGKRVLQSNGGSRTGFLHHCCTEREGKNWLFGLNAPENK
jgi:hypothetical protein